MAMSDEEILREAGRIRANRRLRVAKTCARCGKPFEGLARAKYCSDACRMAAGRESSHSQTSTRQEPFVIQGRLPGESTRDYFIRTADRPLTSEDEEFVAALERIAVIWSKVEGPLEDSLEIIHQAREDRLKQLLGL